MDRPILFALTAPTARDPAVAIAACRAGAIGVVDLEYADGLASMASTFARLEEFTDSDFGVKLAPAAQSQLDDLLASKPTRLRYAVLAGGPIEWTVASLDALRQAGISLLAEATSVEEALHAAQLNVDGIILKGNEAGGRVGPETSFVLLQHWRAVAEESALGNLPFWIQGGMGANSAAACLAGGAAGVLLDSQLLLTTEARLDDASRARLQAFDGAEAVELGRELDAVYRLWTGPQSEALRRLERESSTISASGAPAEDQRRRWHAAVRDTLRESLAREPLVLCGQDAAFARPLAERLVTVGGVITEIRDRMRRNRELAHRFRPLAADAPLAKSHGTRYPLLQGPMTRVSDTAAFAQDVAAGGALPFLALALLRGIEAEKVIAETKTRLGDKPWGVGILGFLPQEIRDEQAEAILKHRPPFAIIAGGRPDQAKRLEDAGIAVYLHVPSPGLLRMFLRSGARRFIFEGRECGGHVGPRSSFVLWETMSQVLQEHLGPRGDGGDLHVVFAGGIHDSLSSSMLACLAAPLAERGVNVGALMGTAYLYTREAVESGAIVPRFQNEVLSARETVLYETGPGHAVRCLRTPYFDAFNAEKQRLRAEGRSHDEMVQTLEWMNIGRLRVASKGLDRAASGSGSQSKLAPVADGEQYERGMYMVGQVAVLHDKITTIAELHEDVCTGGTRRLELPKVLSAAAATRGPCDVAIIGMSAFYPGALGLDSYWENILNRRNAVTEIPETHWDWRLYYDPDQQARDKVVSKWGGFLGDVPFDPFNYGITPKSIPSIEPLQLLVLEGVRQALRDAGYDRRPFDRENTCTVLGVGGGGSALAVSYGLRACLPMFDAVEDLGITSEKMLQKLGRKLPEWTEDSFPGILLNVAAGRVANRFDFGGSNYALDAACASSLAAVHACVRELEQGTCNVAVAIGADTVQTPYAYVAFSKTYALSKRGRCTPFDAAADGIVLSEGIGAVILKRLADAQRDGDRIYAVIKGVGSSSDGMDKGLTAPNSAGQVRAIKRCFDRAGYTPADVTLIEAHGTGTVVGDRTEAMSLSQVMDEAGAERQSCALGSVKSMIGHSKCAAGIAGLIKTVKALEHKTLPPTLVDMPNPNVKFEESALYLNTQPRPWVHDEDRPRRAGVSSFGFGGTNVHLTLEEYRGDFLRQTPPALDHWPAELLVWQAASRQELAAQLEFCRSALEQGARPKLRELAAALWRQRSQGAAARIAIVATSHDDLTGKLASALRLIGGADDQAVDPRGVYFSAAPSDDAGKTAFLFPGQGSQYPNMLAQLAMNFPAVRQSLDEAQQQLADKLDRRLSHYMYPPSPFGEDEEQRSRQALAATQVAQPALGAASVAVSRLWKGFGIEPDLVAGHSYGEFTALWAADALSTDDLLSLSHLRGELIRQATLAQGAGGMVAIDGDKTAAEKLAVGVDGVSLANFNSPAQTVLSATDEGVQRLLERADEQKIRARRLPVACAFHSPLVADANGPLAHRISEIPLQSPRKSVFSNVTGAPYASDPHAVRDVLSRHLTSPVRFIDQIEAMYAAGARVFVEAGPGSVLTGLVGKVLNDKPHLAVATDVPGRDGLEQLAHALGQLFVRGVSVRLDELFDARGIATTELTKLLEPRRETPYSPSTWLVNGVRSRPHNAPEPELMGTRTKSAPPPSGNAAAGDNGTAPITHKPKVSPKVTTNPAMSQPKPQEVAGPIPTTVPAQPMAPMAPAPLLVSELPDDAVQVMIGFQNTMAKFLDTQRSIMLSYLQGGGEAAELAAPAVAPALPQHVAPAVKVHETARPHHVVSEASPAAPPSPPTSPVMVDESASGALENGEALGHAAPPTAGAMVPAAYNGLANWNIDAIGARLLDLLSERTGYPKEMLNLDLDLEADLGIDSIKRVEILGGLTESLNGDGANMQSRLDLEKLTSRRSLRGILNYLDEVLFTIDGEAEVVEAPQPLLSNASAEMPRGERPRPIQRGLVTLVEAPLPAASAPRIPAGAVILTDDGGGVARQIANRLADFGQTTVLVSMAAHDGNGDGYAVDLADPAAVAGLAARLRTEFGAIGGLVHCLPLATANESTNVVDRARRDVKSLYLLARELEPDLRKSGEQGSAFLLAPTALGGELGYGQRDLARTALAAHGGILGFIKCVGLEWPEVLVRAVDLDGSRPAAQLADCLLRELSDPNGPLEVGYREMTRITWAPVAAPLETADERERSPLPAGATVLVTGGARGITAEIAAALGEKYQPNLILAGRSPLPADDETADTAGLTEPAAIKQALMAHAAANGKKAAPAEIESVYRNLQRDREIRANLTRLRDTGAHVEYHSVNVRDRHALAALIADVTARFGRIDGVVHGAGVIEDKLLRDKTPESFDRVFGVKVESAHALSELLDPDELKFCVFFASIASRYGNRGQSDYAAANEVLGKLALELDRRWPARVFSVAWGPWTRVGMVAELEPHLESRGVALIDPAIGAERFIEELEFGWKGESEVLIAGGAEHVTKPPARVAEQATA